MAQLQKRMRPLLGCYVEIALPQTAFISDAFNVAFARIELIQKLLSFHDPASDLSRLNAAHGLAINCHSLSIKCLRLAQATTRVSAGRFNCTFGAILIKNKILPAHNYDQLYGEALLDKGGWQDLELSSNCARLARPVLVTLDGIAKGFAVDSAIAELKRLGIHAGWINAGGDIRVFGDVVLPIAARDHHGQEHLLGGLQNAAIATSTSISTPEFPGVLLDGNGQNLQPITISVIAHSAWRADALTKVAAATPLSKRAEYLAGLGGRWIPLNKTPCKMVFEFDNYIKSSHIKL